MKRIGIVGGGLLGRLAAFILTESGYAVEVYEKTPENPDLSILRAAAFTSAGLLSPISEKDSGGNIIFELGTRSLNLWSCLDRKIKCQTDFSESLLVATTNAFKARKGCI